MGLFPLFRAIGNVKEKQTLCSDRRSFKGKANQNLEKQNTVFPSTTIMKFLATTVLILLSIAHVVKGTKPAVCEPGNYRIRGCVLWKSCCARCPEGHFNDKYSDNTRCEQCRLCIVQKNFEYERLCSPTNNAQCKCKKDHYLDSTNDFCLPLKICAPGEGVSVPATFNTSNKCAECKEGQFSANYSFTERCINHKDCGPCGVKKKGSKMSDVICTICAGGNNPQLPPTSATTKAPDGSCVDGGTVAGGVIGAFVGGASITVIIIFVILVWQSKKHGYGNFPFVRYSKLFRSLNGSHSNPPNSPQPNSPSNPLPTEVPTIQPSRLQNNHQPILPPILPPGLQSIHPPSLESGPLSSPIQNPSSYTPPSPQLSSTSICNSSEQNGEEQVYVELPDAL